MIVPLKRVNEMDKKIINQILEEYNDYKAYIDEWKPEKNADLLNLNVDPGKLTIFSSLYLAEQQKVMARQQEDIKNLTKHIRILTIVMIIVGVGQMFLIFTQA